MYKLYDLTSRSTSHYLQQVNHDQFYECYEVLLSVAGDEIGMVKDRISECFNQDNENADLENELNKLIGNRFGKTNSHTGLEEESHDSLVEFLSSVWERFKDDIPIAIPRFGKDSRGEMAGSCKSHQPEGIEVEVNAPKDDQESYESTDRDEPEPRQSIDVMQSETETNGADVVARI